MSDDDDWDSLEWQFGHAVSDAYKKGRKSMQAERDAAIARAEAAEAQVAKLREALANVDKLRHAVCLVGAHPIDGPRLLAGESGYMRLDLVQQVWLAARAALEPAHD